RFSRDWSSDVCSSDLIYLVWLALAFGVRSWVQWRRTGDAGFRGAALDRGTVQWWARLLFVAALVAGVAGPIAALAGLPPLPGARSEERRVGKERRWWW